VEWRHSSSSSSVDSATFFYLIYLVGHRDHEDDRGWPCGSSDTAGVHKKPISVDCNFCSCALKARRQTHSGWVSWRMMRVLMAKRCKRQRSSTRLTEWNGKSISEIRWCLLELAICDFQLRTVNGYFQFSNWALIQQRTNYIRILRAGLSDSNFIFAWKRLHEFIWVIIVTVSEHYLKT